MSEFQASFPTRALQPRTTPLPGASLPWLADARAAGLAEFERHGLPGARDEQWRYTSLKALEKRSFAAEDPEARSREVPEAALLLPGVDGPRLVFVNGTFRADLSSLALEPGCAVSPLAEAITRTPANLERFLARGPGGRAQGFASLNTAFASDGALVEVAAGTRVAGPLRIVHVGTAAESDVAWHARNIVSLGAGARLTVVEHYLGVGAHAHFGNVVNQLELGAGAELDWIRLNEEGDGATVFERTEVSLSEAAAFASWAIDIGGALARHELEIDLAAPRAKASSRGVFAVRGRQHADHQLAISHGATDTTSAVNWRGIADQRARGVFHGRILVKSGADGADAQLQNKNLLLSPHAEIDTKPVLEIHADEVKAAHGATVGQLDERALFYLRSRGIPATLARNMLTFAFCRSVLDDLPLPALREHLATLLMARLPTAKPEEATP